MTWIVKAAAGDPAERAKWQVQAVKAAQHIKSMSWDKVTEVENFVAGFAFDDGFVQMPINVSLIQRLNERALAQWIFDAMLARASTDHAAPASEEPVTGGESKDAPTRSPAPEAACSEPCMRRLEPDFTQPCPNVAQGGLRITLKPAETIEKRWGMKSMLTFVMDLTVCAECLPKVRIEEISDDEFRRRLGKTAQQMNKGVLVDWKRTVIEGVGFNDPHYRALRAEQAAKAANDSQPAPAGQQGATDGQPA